jgi:hypothetical protein
LPVSRACGDFKRHGRGIDGVEPTVKQREFDIDQRVFCQPGKRTPTPPP